MRGDQDTKHYDDFWKKLPSDQMRGLGGFQTSVEQTAAEVVEIIKE